MIDQNSNQEDLYKRAAGIITHFISENELEYKDKIEDERLIKQFQEKFSSSVLKNIPDDKLLNYIFLCGDKSNLCYTLEFDKNYLKFGSIAGGSAHKYKLFKKKDTGKWIYGTPSTQSEVPEKEALKKGKEIKNALIEGAEAIKSNPFENIDDYEKLDIELSNILKKINMNSKLGWIHKYYYLIFPDKFSEFHNEDWQNHILNKFNIKPNSKAYGRDGQIVLISKMAEIPTKFFGKVFVNKYNSPKNPSTQFQKRIWRIYPTSVENDEFEDYWSSFKNENYIGIGYDLIDENLNNFESKQELKDYMVIKSGNENSRVYLQIWDFVNSIEINDYIIASGSENQILGIGLVKSSYIPPENNKNENIKKYYPQVREVEWIKTKKKNISFKYKSQPRNTLEEIDLDCWNRIKGEYCREKTSIKNLKNEFVDWFSKNSPQSYKQYMGLFKRDQMENIYFESFNDRLFEVDLDNIPKKIKLIKGKIENKDKTSFADYNARTGQGVPSAIINKHYINFLRNYREYSKTDNLYNHPDVNKYTKKDFLDEVVFKEKEYDELIDLIKRKKNIILQGSPGVGKTFIAKRLAYSIIGEKNEGRVEFVQFHQSYSYEDFIQGYRPIDEGFKLKNGVFYNFCKKAEADPENYYFFIIDEINRGNISKIFGELLMLIEEDKRGEDFAIHLTYSDDDPKFCVSENLYIIGMMNTADRSLAILDYALRRRFVFYPVSPLFDKDDKNDNIFREYLTNNGVDNELATILINKFKELNNLIRVDEDLGDGFKIGHSYFCGQGRKNIDWYNSIIDYEIAPLLKEYWFDDEDKAKEEIENLRISSS